MRWTWDEEKDRTNKAKHGVSFETAQLVFEEEERWRTIGSPHDAIDLVLLVVHTWPIPDETAEEVGRIISARKATREERRQYEEGKF